MMSFSWLSILFLGLLSISVFTVDRLFIILKCLVIAWDIVTLPIYFVIQNPITTYKRANRIRARRENENIPDSPFVRVGEQINFDENLLACDTMDSWFRYVVSKYGSQPCFGTRERFAEIEEKQNSGKIAKKFVLDHEYKFKSYIKVEEMIDSIMRGFLSCGIKPRDLVPIFAETREEWMLTALALWRMDAVVVTLYANLGTDGILVTLNQTKATHLITSDENIPKLIKLADKIPKLQTIIYMHSGCRKSPEPCERFKLIPFKDICNEEHPEQKATKSPNADDVALIMYTSGSTGVPKGVELTHDNFIGALKSLTRSSLGSYQLGENEVYLAYLPLAHIFEIGAEITLMSFGVPIAYSSPQTMLDISMGIRKGTPGDMTLVKPTVMPAVPLILERIKKSVENRLNESPAVKQLFEMSLNYKKFWTNYGFQTPLLDKLIFSRLKVPLGGRLRLMFVGSAPLAVETQEFISLAMCINLLQGYAATEATAAASLMDMEDRSYGRVGAPLFGEKIKLVDWKEGGYCNSDKPNPRGEIMIGGQSISRGYFENPEETVQAFYEENGLRWWRSGDIGEFFEDGTFKIVDRKKDLIKLQHGEYVSLGKVEAGLKNILYVDNICVYGDSLHTNVIALVLPERNQIESLAAKLNKDHLSWEEKCKDKEIENHVLKCLIDEGTSRGLLRYEIPTKIKLCPEEWTPDNGLTTAAMKIRRHQIKQYYQKDITQLYSPS